MNKRILMVALASMGIASTGAFAGPNYCNQNFDPIVGQYLLSVQSIDLITGQPTTIATQMQIGADGLAQYADSSHLGQSALWDPQVDSPRGLLSTDGYFMFKKTSGSNYKLFGTFVLGYPTPQGTEGVFPTKDFKRYVTLGTAVLSKDCSTLTGKACNLVIPSSVDEMNPNEMSCNGHDEHTFIFKKIPNL